MKALNKTQTAQALNIAARIAEAPATDENFFRRRDLLNQYSAATRPTQEDAQPMDYASLKTETVLVKDVKPGDLLVCTGFIGQVEECKTVEYPEGLCLCAKVSYVAGSVENFNWMIETIENGTARGHRAYVQGNDRNNWQKVITE